MRAEAKRVETSHCAIAYAESRPDGPVCLLIHGNSSCKEVFRNQMTGEPGRRYRLIAFDLPGHGASEDARDPELTYRMGGYADAIMEAAQGLGVTRAALLGWSLGGHIGLDAIGRYPGIAGLMISGTPPIPCTEEGFAAGFLRSEHMHLAGQESLSEQEIEAYAHATCGRSAPFEPFLREAVARTDGRARRLMIGAFAGGRDPDQLQLAVESRVPLAIVNGAEDEFVDNAYIASLPYKTLWDGRVHDLEGVGHAPFWEAPERFDPLFLRFLDDVIGS